MKLCIAVLGVSLIGQTAWNAEKERALGEGVAKTLLAEAQQVPKGELTAYVEQIGARLASSTGRPFRFEVVARAEYQEPVGLPGGIVIVPAELLLATDDEAEFAGMLAHAMGHGATPDGFTLGQGSFATIPLFFLTTHESGLMPLGFLPKAREKELQADQFGAELAGKAGFDTGGLERYVRRTQKADVTPNFSPLPEKERRLAALAPFVTGTGQVASSEFVQAKQRAQALLGVRPARVSTLRR